jgi:hypothetical protein
MATLHNAHPALAGRFNSLLADVEARFGAGVVGITSGWRSNAQQKALYAKKGPKWAAKPGSSNHEYGAALDLNVKGGWKGAVGQYVHQVAAKHGLFFPMSYEPWHIEAIGLNRKTIGHFHDDSHDPDSYSDPPVNDEPQVDPVQQSMNTMLRALGVPGIPDAVAAGQEKAGGAVAGGAAAGAATGVGGVIGTLYNAGFRGQKLVEAYAISKAESGHRADAFNGNADTGDKSYGWFQINMLGNLGPARLQQYGLGSNEALFDPATNARVAYQMSGGGSNWRPWSVWKKGSYRKFMAEGESAARNAGLL